MAKQNQKNDPKKALDSFYAIAQVFERVFFYGFGEKMTLCFVFVSFFAGNLSVWKHRRTGISHKKAMTVYEVQASSSFEVPFVFFFGLVADAHQ